MENDTQVRKFDDIWEDDARDIYANKKKEERLEGRETKMG